MQRARTTDGELVAPAPGQRATCPYCDATMTAKCGAILSWHWAHIGQTCMEWELRYGRGETASKENLPPAGTCYTCDRWERGCTFVHDADVDAWQEQWTRPTPQGLVRVYEDAPPCPMYRMVKRRTPYGELPEPQRVGTRATIFGWTRKQA
jgi:hypothetical protein